MDADQLDLLAQRAAGDASLFGRVEDAVRPAIRYLMSRYYIPGAQKADVEQLCRIGLLKALRGFDPSRGGFQAYAIWTMAGEIKTALTKARRRHRAGFVEVPLTDVATDGEDDDLVEHFTVDSFEGALLDRIEGEAGLAELRSRLTPVEDEVYGRMGQRGFHRTESKRTDNALLRIDRKARALGAERASRDAESLAERS